MKHSDFAATMLQLEANSFDPTDVADATDARELEQSLAYLASDAALESLARDGYWPKWDSPWWHMLLLHERGQSHLIPRPAVDA